MGNESNLLGGISGAIRGVLGGVAGTAGGFINGALGGVVNVANSAVSGAATIVDGAAVGVGDLAVKGAGLAVVGATSFVDVICGYARGVFGTVGGFLNNTVIEAVDVIGGKGTSHLYGLHKDGNPKEHFGELGSVIGAVVGEGGGLNGVRSSLSWSSKPTNWGVFNPFFGVSGQEVLSLTLADEPTQTQPAVYAQSAQTDTSETVVATLPAVLDNIAQSSIGDSAPQSIISNIVEQPIAAVKEAVTLPVGLVDLFSPNAQATTPGEVNVASFDNLLSPANDLLHEAANAVAVVM